MTPEKLVHKFAIVGTTSSGKTTLADEFKRRFAGNRHIHVLDEGARIYFETHPEVLKAPVHVYPVQKDIQDFVHAREMEAHRENPRLIISDRSVVDPVVLFKHFNPTQNPEDLLEGVRSWLPTYTGFIVTDPEGVPYDQDQFRQETPQDRLQIHDEYLAFLKDQGLAHVVISGNTTERMLQSSKFILERIDETTVFDRQTHVQQ